MAVRSAGAATVLTRKPMPNFTGAIRLAGNDSYCSTGGNAAISTLFKVRADAPFSRIRLRVYGKEAAASTLWKAIVAPTETAASDTQNNRYVPIVGGSAFNSAWSSSNPFGWRSVTFGGVATGGIPLGTSARASELVSDWIECSSVPRADGGAGFLSLIRLYHPGAVGNTHTVVGNQTPVPYVGWRGAFTAAEPFYRDFSACVFNGDSVGTLTNMPTIDYSADTNWGFWIAVEFDFDVPVRTVLAVGTSITTGGGGQIYAFDNWSTRAILSLSTRATPIMPFNGGMSGQNTAAFLQGMADLLASGLRPTDVIIEGHGPNDGSPTTALNQTRRFNIMAAPEEPSKRCADSEGLSRHRDPRTTAGTVRPRRPGSR